MLSTIQPLCKGRFASKKFNQTQRIQINACKRDSLESKVYETLDSIANTPRKDTLRTSKVASVDDQHD